MFEYLMPMLWMKTYPETLLANSMDGAVACQRAAVEKLGIPWGISEGACSARNDAGHYEYQAFGVKALALKAETPKRLVITPYAAFLALNVDPANAVRNCDEMHQQKWVGCYGILRIGGLWPPEHGEKVRRGGRSQLDGASSGHEFVVGC